LNCPKKLMRHLKVDPFPLDEPLKHFQQKLQTFVVRKCDQKKGRVKHFQQKLQTFVVRKCDQKKGRVKHFQQKLQTFVVRKCDQKKGRVKHFQQKLQTFVVRKCDQKKGRAPVKNRNVSIGYPLPRRQAARLSCRRGCAKVLSFLSGAPLRS